MFSLSFDLSQLKKILVNFIQQNLQTQDEKLETDPDLDFLGGGHLIPFIVFMQEVS